MDVMDLIKERSNGEGSKTIKPFPHFKTLGIHAAAVMNRGKIQL